LLKLLTDLIPYNFCWCN